jgi:hypothetical protein
VLVQEPTVLYHQHELLQIWLPDTFILNAKEEAFSSEVEGLEALKLVMTNQTHCMLDYMVKMTARISCQLNYRFYPMDVQFCNLSLRSCKFERRFSWKIALKVTLNLNLCPFADTTDRNSLRYHWIGPGEQNYQGFTYDKKSFATKGLIFLSPPRLLEYELGVETDEHTTFECNDISP